MRFCLIVSLAMTIIILVACNNNTPDTIPAKPATLQFAKDFIKGKKFKTLETGFWGNLTVNDKTEAEWINVKTETEKYAKEAAEEQSSFALQFVNDTTVTIFKKDSSFTAAYTIDDKVGEYDDAPAGIKLRITYVDTEFAFGGQPTEVTYTYAVLGAEDDKLLLQLPRSVNRRELISLLKAE